MPPGVTTSTATAPAAFTGVTAVIDVALFTVKLVALVLPKRTAVAPVKSVPVIVTVVPPAVGPLFGLTDEIVGIDIASDGTGAAEAPAEAPAGEEA